MNESDPRSEVHYLGSSESKAWKKNFEKQLTALHVVRTFHRFKRCVHFVDKNADQDQNCSIDLIYFQGSGVYTHWFFYMRLILLSAKYQRIFIGKSKELLAWLAICLLLW